MSVKAKADAIDRFVRTLKSAGLYDDIQAACVMAGWTNLAGALYPLKGAAPTNGGGLFQDADLDPGIGLKGNGSSKYLNTNRANNADGQDDRHLAVYASQASTINNTILMGVYGGSPYSVTQFGHLTSSSMNCLINSQTSVTVSRTPVGFIGGNRSNSANTSLRVGGVTTAGGSASNGNVSLPTYVFCRNTSGTASNFADATLSWYSIGSATDLAALDSAVSTLMSDLRAIDEDGFDRDALAYIRAVEAADGSFLETGVKQAVDRLVKGLKYDKDGNGRSAWDAIGASCLLCGPRTIAGALVPLKGVAPTAYNFVSADYNQETGLVGDGTTKYLDSNRAGNADGQNDAHVAIYGTTLTASTNWAGSGGATVKNSTLSWYSPYFYLNMNGPSPGNQRVSTGFVSSGFVGVTRTGSTSTTARYGAVNFSDSTASSTPSSSTNYLFAYNNDGTASEYSNARLAFYSVGASLSLSSLDSRITKYVADVAAAIP